MWIRCHIYTCHHPHIRISSYTTFVHEARKLKKLDVRGCQGTTTCVLILHTVCVLIHDTCVLILHTVCRHTTYCIRLTVRDFFSDLYWETKMKSSVLFLKHFKNNVLPPSPDPMTHFLILFFFFNYTLFFFLFDFNCVFWQRMMARCFLFSDFTVFLSTCIFLTLLPPRCFDIFLQEYIMRIHKTNMIWMYGGQHALSLTLSLFSLSLPPCPLSFHYKVFPPSWLSLHAWHIS